MGRSGLQPRPPTPPGRLGCEPTSGILPKALITLLDHLYYVPASHSKRVWASLLVAHHHRVLSWNLVEEDAAHQTQHGLPPQAPSEAAAAVRRKQQEEDNERFVRALLFVGLLTGLSP